MLTDFSAIGATALDFRSTDKYTFLQCSELSRKHGRSWNGPRLKDGHQSELVESILPNFQIRNSKVSNVQLSSSQALADRVSKFDTHKNLTQIFV